MGKIRENFKAMWVKFLIQKMCARVNVCRNFWLPAIGNFFVKKFLRHRYQLTSLPSAKPNNKAPFLDMDPLRRSEELLHRMDQPSDQLGKINDLNHVFLS